MQEYLWVGLGGFVGANARYALGAAIATRVGPSFPLQTLVINVTGSLLIGAMMYVLTERIVADPAWRLLLVVGFLGGYTTFSTFTYEAVTLVRSGDWAMAATYVVGHNLLGLAATVAGLFVARALAGAGGGPT